MTARLELRDVSVHFGAVAALDGVDLSLPTGHRHALIGPNGAGKSTLLGVLGGEQRPDRGRVLLDGRDITGTGPARRARLGVARTFQEPALIDSLSTLDNAMLAGWTAPGRPTWPPARRRAATRRARDLLDLVGVAADSHRLAGNLPHGHRRLLELAVALAGEPRVLLLDEPAAGLTDAEVARLVDLLTGGLPPELTLLLVEHQLDLVAAVAQTVTVLAAGRVLVTGTYREVASDDGVLAAYPLAVR